MIRKCLFSSIAGLVALVAIAGLTPQANAQQLPPGQQAQGGEARYRDGEVLVKFRANVTDAEIATAFRGAGLQMLRHILTGPMKANGEIGITHTLTAMPVEQAVELLNRLPGIEYAQPNWIYTHQLTPNDPYFTLGDLWGMGTGFGCEASTTWETGVIGSTNVYIGVIDEGIQYNHLDLAGNMWINTGEGSVANGVDDDGNGYIDDFYGWNGFVDNGNIYDANSDDHGTHVAGTIGATGGNNLGVIGVSPVVKLISGKFLGPNGGATSDAIQVIDYMTRLKTERAVNIVALNNSWGGGGSDPALLESIVRAAKADILFVAASGNGDSLGRAINTDASPNYPSCYNTANAGATYDSVIAVTAIARGGTKADFANYGATTVDLGAPGVDIYSTLPGSGYGSYSGTSMATPHVTGAIALYAARYPGAKAVDIKEALMSSTEVTTSLGGKTVTGGRLNVPKFLLSAPPGWTEPVYTVAPTAPTAFAATATNFNSISLSWVDNSNNETNFVLTRASGTVTTDIVIPANMESYTDTKLAANTSYTYTLQACNPAGAAAATQITVTTPQAPAPATAVSVSTDTVSKGNWLGNYGLDGYDILDYRLLPSYATVAFASFAPHTWASSTTDLRALRTPNGSSRFAKCYYSTTSLTIDVNINDQAEHTVSLYCVDYDRKGRVQTIQIWDPNSPITPLNEQTISNFGDGIYLTWKITGSVIIKIIYAGGTQNAVVSGVFLDPNQLPAPTGLTAKATSGRIDLSWTYSSPDATGFTIERSKSSTTGFAIINASVAKEARGYTDTSVSRNTTYYYRVRANPNGKYSNTASAKTPAK